MDFIVEGARAHNIITANAGDKFYRPKSIKRFRRTKATIGGIRQQIYDILSNDHPQTVRQIFYALTVRGAIAKEEKEYHGTVVRLARCAHIPFDWITDNTRLMRKPSSFTGLESCLRSTAQHYRRNLWAAAPVYVEIWVEKDALSGVLFEETEVYDVPLMPARGYASTTFLHSAATAIEAKGKPAYIYHFGDLDPSGVDAARDIEVKLRRYGRDRRRSSAPQSSPARPAPRESPGKRRG